MTALPEPNGLKLAPEDQVFERVRVAVEPPRGCRDANVTLRLRLARDGCASHGGGIGTASLPLFECRCFELGPDVQLT